MAMQTATSPSSKASSNTDVRARLDQMISYIKQGKIIEAMHEFYSSDTKMQENGNPPTVGLEANVEREKQFLAQVREWKGFTVTASAAEGDVSFMEAVIEFVNHQNKPVRMEQVSRAKWRNGKIVSERFYYDASGKK